MKLRIILESKVLTAIISCLIIVVIFVIIFKNNDNNTDQTNQVAQAKQVKTTVVHSVDQNSQSINLVGKVSPSNFVDVVALSQGTMDGVFFELGDKVSRNQTLAFLKNSLTSTNLSTAHTSYLNMLNNLAIVRRAADETIRQAEIGVANASESVRLAELSLQSALDSLKNNTNIQSQGNDNLKKSAIISYDEYLNFINSALDDANYIVAAEVGEQLAGANLSLSAKNTQALIDAKDDYRTVKNKYLVLRAISPVESNILHYMNEVYLLMSDTNILMNSVLEVLKNTTENSILSEAELLSERSTYSGFLNNTVTMKAKVQTDINKLEGIGLNDQSLADTLQSAISSAESQLEIAKTSYDNALVNLEKSKQAKSQQVLSAQISIDNSLGQLNINRDQFSDLTLRAPIDGSITKVAVDVGTEVSPGQLIATISQVDKLVIEVNLSSEDIYRVKVGQKVMINDKWEAEISFISPVADSVTRKVRAEINFDNKDNILIPGTTVDIVIDDWVDEIMTDKKDSIFIPLRAVNVGQVASTVFVVENNLASKREVETGEQKGSSIEIVSGLTEGDVLIIEGNKSLENGDSLEIKN